MNVFQSLMTRGALVITPNNRHGMVEVFDSHSNMVELSFFDGHPNEAFHITRLRAGTNISEKMATGHVTAAFPKILAVEADRDPGQALTKGGYRDEQQRRYAALGVDVRKPL